MTRTAFDTKLTGATLWLLYLLPVAMTLSRFAEDAVLSVVAVLFLIRTAATRDFSWLQNRWVQVLLALWAYISLTSFLAPDVGAALYRSVPWVRYPIFAAALCYWLLRDEKNRGTLMLILASTVAFITFDTILQYITGTDLLGRESIPTLEGSPRLTGPFSAPRAGITLAWLSFPVIFWYMLDSTCQLRERKKLLGGLALGVALITTIFITGERMAVLLTGLGLTIGFFMLPVSKKYFILFCTLLAITCAVAAHFNPALINRQVKSTAKVTTSFWETDYGLIWSSAINIAKENWLVGIGARNFRVVCEDAKYGAAEFLPRRCNQHPHNIYLEWLSEHGVIGFGGFLFAVYLTFAALVPKFRTLRYHPIFIGLLIVYLTRLWPIASSTSFFTAWSSVPFWLVWGWMLAYVFNPPPAKTGT